MTTAEDSMEEKEDEEQERPLFLPQVDSVFEGTGCGRCAKPAISRVQYSSTLLTEMALE